MGSQKEAGEQGAGSRGDEGGEGEGEGRGDKGEKYPHTSHTSHTSHLARLIKTYLRRASFSPASSGQKAVYQKLDEGVKDRETATQLGISCFSQGSSHKLPKPFFFLSFLGFFLRLVPP